MTFSGLRDAFDADVGERVELPDGKTFELVLVAREGLFFRRLTSFGTDSGLRWISFSALMTALEHLAEEGSVPITRDRLGVLPGLAAASLSLLDGVEIRDGRVVGAPPDPLARKRFQGDQCTLGSFEDPPRQWRVRS